MHIVADKTQDKVNTKPTENRLYQIGIVFVPLEATFVVVLDAIVTAESAFAEFNSKALFLAEFIAYHLARSLELNKNAIHSRYNPLKVKEI